MEEIWKDVVGYEGLYEVSNLGRVRSLNYLRTGQTRILKSHMDRKGYLGVALCKNGKATYKLVHRLVAMAFIPNPMNFPMINHKDENPLNNVVFLDESGALIPERSNLEWCTAKYNSNYGTITERIAKALSKKVHQFDHQGNLIKEWTSIHEVSRQTGWSQGHISDCCLGKLKTFHGYVWRYANNQGE